MAWERRGGREYYYRKVRRGGRVFSVYEGGGIVGALSAESDTAKRAKAAAEQRDLRRRMASEDAIDAKIDATWNFVRAQAEAALEAAGYHQHKRQWRLRRDEKTTDRQGG